MKAIASIFVLVASAIIGLAADAPAAGHGDAGRYILQQAVRFGCAPVSTNGLPAITNAWKYSETADGRGILVILGPESSASTEAFLNKAFGSPKYKFKKGLEGPEGLAYMFSPKGGYIQFTHDKAGGQLAILRFEKKNSGDKP
jgi:hypothetical protein